VASDCIVLSELLPVTAGDRMAGWAGWRRWLARVHGRSRQRPEERGERPSGTPPPSRAVSHSLFATSNPDKRSGRFRLIRAIAVRTGPGAPDSTRGGRW